jgi:hypothetical protein
MDQEVYQKTLNYLYQDDNYIKYHDLFKQFQFDENKLVYGRYLCVSPPIPNMIHNDIHMAKNILSMHYNRLYNEKYKIDPYAYSSDDSSEEDEQVSTDWAYVKLKN